MSTQPAQSLRSSIGTERTHDHPDDGEVRVAITRSETASANVDVYHQGQTWICPVSEGGVAGKIRGGPIPDWMVNLLENYGIREVEV